VPLAMPFALPGIGNTIGSSIDYCIVFHDIRQKLELGCFTPKGIYK
jgi:hypothetical protein